MPQVCWYFQLHQPYRLRDFSLFDVGRKKTSYFSDRQPDGNRAIFHKVAAHSYFPMLQLLLILVRRYPSFHCTLSLSGVWLEQAQTYEPRVIKLLQKLVATGQVELLAETYYHTLACLYSPTEFQEQVRLHQQKMVEVFNIQPRVFRNTELVYSDEIGRQVQKLGFTGMLTEGVDRSLHGRARTQVFIDSRGTLPLLLKHAQLSDDIAFRFSDRNWNWYPLQVEKYREWLDTYGPDELINLFMDFETFGEHQWADSGIFDFFERLISELIQKPEYRFVTPSQILETVKKPLKKSTQKHQLPIYHVPEPISWADVNRDLTAWIDNPLQRDCLRVLYELEKPVLASKNQKLIDDWRKLQTSDHFYYMCTKWAADGDVHAYFSPYSSPYEAYRRYSIVLGDLKSRLA